jgi:serine/threonine-protein kinase
LHADTLPGQRPSPRPDGDLIGETIDGKYAIEGLLGRGGMGTVFEARHVAIDRRVAVKVLHAAQAQKANAVKRFHQEARAAGAIGHPNICAVYDLGTLDDGRPYLVMERLEGETLAERIAVEGALPFDDVVDAMVQVASALVVTHHKGIVHRDIKPENVFLTRQTSGPPLVKLLDFGVSKMMTRSTEGPADEADLTRIGMVVGTPHYMAPEQARGDRDLDGRVDVYACGVILYEALTGRRPFNAPSYEALLLQILAGAPRPPTELRPALPASFELVIQRAMALGREDRYPTTAELQLDLEGLRASSPHVRSTPSPDPTQIDDIPVFAAALSVEIPVTFDNDTIPSGEGKASFANGPAPSAAPDTPVTLELEDEPTRQMVRREPGT